MQLQAGQIVLVDWPQDPEHPEQAALPPDPNKLRPAGVVQDTELFDPSYPTVLVVPMTGDRLLALPELTVVLTPNPINGCRKVSYLLPQHITCIAKTRIQQATASWITADELVRLRELVVLTGWRRRSCSGGGPSWSWWPIAGTSWRAARPTTCRGENGNRKPPIAGGWMRRCHRASFAMPCAPLPECCRPQPSLISMSKPPRHSGADGAARHAALSPRC